MAVYLEISLRTHPELLWIASAAICAELPLGWVEVPAPLGGRASAPGAAASSGRQSPTAGAAGAAGGVVGASYYTNTSLGSSQWEHPAHCHWRGVARYLVEAKAEAQAEAAAAATPRRRRGD